MTDDELDAMAGQLDVILSAVSRVQEVTAEEIPPTSHAVPLTNVLRPDVPAPSLTADAALAMAPASEQDRFRVPRILDEE
jgi:aspartyl-tRNA(Asn)/glutamyl-tRNA(Gln) amidotransferase subunit C